MINNSNPYQRGTVGIELLASDLNPPPSSPPAMKTHRATLGLALSVAVLPRRRVVKGQRLDHTAAKPG